MKMQQTKSYWRLVALAGLVSSFVGTACVVTTSDDDSSAGASGAGAPGAGAGGATAGAGGAITAGAGGASAGTGGATAGTAGVDFQCDPADGMAVGTPNVCPSTTDSDVCQACIATSCCTEYAACFATSPGNQCGWGGPMDQGEIICALTCIQQGAADSGIVDDTLLGTCANQCATTIANGGTKECTVIGSQTSDLIGCMNTNCQTQCFTG